MEKEIYLCGTNHFDLNGPKKLKKVLNKIHPKVIALETTKKDFIEVIEENKDSLKNTKKIQSGIKKILKNKDNKSLIIKFFSSIGYECWVPYNYSKNKRINIIFLENKKITDNFSNEFRNALKIKDILNIFIMKTKDFEKIFINPKKNIIKNKKWLKIMKKTELIKRNKIFARKIEKLNGKILVICGIDHIFGKEPNLRKLLRKYEPKLINLSENKI